MLPIPGGPPMLPGAPPFLPGGPPPGMPGAPPPGMPPFIPPPVSQAPPTFVPASPNKNEAPAPSSFAPSHSQAPAPPSVPVKPPIPNSALRQDNPELKKGQVLKYSDANYSPEENRAYDAKYYFSPSQHEESRGKKRARAEDFL